MLDWVGWRTELKFLSRCTKLEVGTQCARWGCMKDEEDVGCAALQVTALCLLESSNRCSAGSSLVKNLVTDLVVGD